MPTQKLKISSDFFSFKLLSVIGLLYFLLLLTDYRRTDSETIFSLVFGCVFLITLLYYFSTRPKIYYSENSLFIKKFNQEEIEVPFKKITSIKLCLWPPRRGITTYEITFYHNAKIETIVVYTSILAEPFSKFKQIAKEKNPKIIT